MLKTSVFLILFFVITSYSHAGSCYSSSYNQRGSVAASIEIVGKGIYNLVVSIEFLKEPKDRTPFNSDNYEELLNRLNVEWKDIALNVILNSNRYKLSDLASLKNSITNEIANLVSTSKPKHKIKEDVEVVFSISSFYLVNLNEE